MANVLDYLEWRGDISFDQDGVNEVDNLIMSIISYLEFDGVVPPLGSQDSITLSQVAEQAKSRIEKLSALEHNLFLKQVPGLFYKTATSARYRDVKLSNYVNQTDDDLSEQFSAVVLSLDNGQHFIAYRGTDDTLNGWKEDFHMSFKDEVLSQKQAIDYMHAIFSLLKGKFFMGGHSKGGNLAVYAGAHADHAACDRIVQVFNNDGPGFHANIIQSEGYQSLIGKINTFIPKSSIIGMLLEHRGDYKVVDSHEKGILQHNAFTWEVKGPGFVYEKGLTRASLAVNHILRAWLDQLSTEQRAQFINALFHIIQATGAKTVGDLSKEKLALARSMIRTFRHLDADTQSYLKHAVSLFFQESRKLLRNAIVTDIDAMLSKRRSRRIRFRARTS